MRAWLYESGSSGSAASAAFTPASTKRTPSARSSRSATFIKERADSGAERFGGKAFYSVKELLDSGIKLDACSMCTRGEENGGDHFTPTMELLEAGIPFLVRSRSLTASPRPSRWRRWPAASRSRTLLTSTTGFTPAALRAKEWVDAGRREPQYHQYAHVDQQPVETSPWFHLRALHPHSFDVMRYFCGDVVSVAAFLRKGEGRICYSKRPGAAPLRKRRRREPHRQL